MQITIHPFDFGLAIVVFGVIMIVQAVKEFMQAKLRVEAQLKEGRTNE